MKKQLLILTIFLLSTIWSFGQGGIDNLVVKTSELTIKPLTGSGLRTLAVDNNGVIIPDSIRIAKGDSAVTYYTPFYLNTNFATIEDLEAVQSAAAIKLPVDAATTGEDLDLSGAETIDGYSVTTGARVLVHNQTLPEQNGIYVSDAGSWARASDFNTWAELYRSYVVILNGDSLQGAAYVSDMASTGTLGGDSIYFNVFTTPSSVVAGNGLDNVGNNYFVDVDNSTIEINSNKLRIKDGGVMSGKLAANIDATKIANGVVSNAEFQALNNVATDKTIQYQIDSLFDRSDEAIKNIIISSRSSNTMVFIPQKTTGAYGSAFTIAPADVLYAGLLTSANYNKLGSIETGAEKNKQANWSTTSTSDDSYILNKPDVIVKSDTVRSASEPISTIYYVDSLHADIMNIFDTLSTGDSYWDISTNGDTLSSTTGNVKLDTVTMGVSEIILPNIVSYGFTSLGGGYIYDGGASSLANTYRYVMNETGQIRYKIHSVSTTYYIARSMDYGVTWANIKTITYNSFARTGLECSNFGDVVAYTDYSGTTNTLYVSRNYGADFFGSTIGSSITETAALDISDDGLLVALGATNDSIYIYRDALKGQAITRQDRIVYDIKVDNDSTIYYMVGKTADTFNRVLYSVTPTRAEAIIYPHARVSFSFDYENKTIYVADSIRIWKRNITTDLNFVELKNMAAPTYKVAASKDGTYIYATIDPGYVRISTNSGADFTALTSGSYPQRFDFIEINEGISTENVRFYYQGGRMYFADGGITMSDSYTPTYSKDVITKDYYLASQSGSGDITAVNTNLNSGLQGGSSTGDVNLRLSVGNLASASPATIGDADEFAISDYSSTLETKKITALAMKSYFTGGTGTDTVTQVNSGAGMNFSNFTTSGTITMGQPTALTKLTTNLASGTTHQHSINLESFTIGDLNLISNPSVSNVYLKWNGSTFEWSTGVGASGVTSIILPTTGGLYNYTGIATDPTIVLNINGLNPITPSLMDYIPFADVSSGTTPMTCGKMTLSTLKSTLGSGLNVIFDDDSVQNVTRLIVSGSGVSALTGTTGTATLAITGGGGGEEGFQTLAETGNVTWSWLTSKNAKMLDVDGNIILSFTNQTDGQQGYLEVKGDPTTDYTLTFPAGSWLANNRASRSFNIEHGTKYVFYLKYTGTDTNIDYATYGQVN